MRKKDIKFMKRIFVVRPLRQHRNILVWGDKWLKMRRPLGLWVCLEDLCNSHKAIWVCFLFLFIFLFFLGMFRPPNLSNICLSYLHQLILLTWLCRLPNRYTYQWSLSANKYNLHIICWRKLHIHLLIW